MCVMMFTNIDRVVEDFHDPNVGISTVKLYIYITHTTYNYRQIDMCSIQL